MKKLRQEMTDFFRSVYQGEAKTLVFGCGAKDADVLLIGEAPGEQEVLQGRPFVGKAGKNLDEFLSMSGFDRDKLYITNVVKFRPVKISEKGTVSNRTPTKEEVALFKPWLMREIGLVRPRIVVTLGNTALRALMGNKISIGDVHGRLQRTEDDALLFPLYHPASVIYNRALRDTYIGDVMQLRAWREGAKL